MANDEKNMTPDERMGANPRVFTMGEGSVVISYGFYKQLPCIFIADAKKPGKVGDSAKGELNENGGIDNSVVIRFSTPDSIMNHLDLIQSMVEYADKRFAEIALQVKGSP